MKRKILCLSTAVIGMLIILGSLSPSICSKDIDTVTIQVNRYYGINSDPIITKLSYNEAKEIKEILIELNKAIENNDENAISMYESMLNQKGIFGNEYQKFYSQKTISEKMKYSRFSNLLDLTKEKLEDNISNKLCYFNAIGTGGIFFQLAVKFIEAMRKVLENASNFVEALVLLLILLPLFVVIYFLTHLIPFRILMPIGVISMKNGSMSSLGLEGFKRVVVGDEYYTVNVSYFTGLTINFFGSEDLSGFLFASGIAFEVKETET